MSRPPRHQVDRVFTKLWFANASERADGATPYWFWKNIDEGKGHKASWERYKRGLRTPDRSKGSNPIAKVEAKFPGTARLFDSPVRAVLKGSKISQEQASAAIANIGDPYKRIILEGGYNSPSIEQPGEFFIEEMFQQLSLFPCLELVEVIVLMLAWADDIGNPKLWNHVCTFYRAMIPELIRENNLMFHEELLELVDDIAQVRDFKSVRFRENVYQSWRDEGPEHFINQDRVRFEMLEFWHNHSADPRAWRTRQLK